MIIGIDVSSVVYGTGVSNYTLNLLRSLLKKDKINTYKLFFTSMRLPVPEEIKKLSKQPNVKLYQFKIPLTILSFLWNRLHLVNIEFFIGKCDIFHCSDWTQPPSIHAKLVTTIHDLTPFLYPHWLPKKIVETHKQKMYWAARKCHKFICVSQNTLDDLLKVFPQIDKSKCQLIYEAAEDKYFQFNKLSPQEQQKKINTIEKQYGLRNYILSQGTREPRKNLKNLILAFNRYLKKHPKSKVELAISGKYGWGQDVSTVQHPQIKILGYIPEKDMVALHAAALFMAYPSFYEGFGLPLVKSMAVGVPVLTSNTSSLPEIAGEGGIIVKPNSIQSIYKGIEKLLSNKKYRQKIASKAIEQAKLFSWSKCASETLDLYSKLIA